MNDVQKRIILQNANTLEVNNLISLIEKGEISLEEFKQAGLTVDKIRQIEGQINLEAAKERAAAEIAKREEEERLAKFKIQEEKNEFLKKVVRKRVTVDEIRNKINNGYISFDDLEDEGISQRTINSIKYYSNSNRVTIFKKIDDLPPMEEGRTDVYFVGLPGSGKSTMLSGLLNVANKEGILLPDTYSNDGAVYQTQIVSDLSRGVLPNATASGSYNYVAMSLNDENKKKHPFNVVEVPGELYVNMFNNANVDDLLKYIKNSNKKILIFVIDSLAHDTNYADAKSALDQSLVYVNILNMFKSSGILNQTDAIYLVANKFDAIKESRYDGDNRPDVDLAYEFLNEEFKNLLNNCTSIRDESKNKFKIKILPYSIGKVSYEFIVEDFNRNYSSIVINNLIEDSFVVKGGKWGLFN
ncbi:MULTISPECIES: TRAFAC clade GTPase domain-containing protein [Weeksellaceae]|uniref:Double-GTPase 1 domain-containing protein n=1 Tax=Algoriella xinjiangensis TaxID=684065 RepID=A0A1I4XRY1_9FLAO|nr:MULTISPECIES: hypothetical protein [Weeksellaceae]SFN28436.1 hypothetical protein SAMN05421738_109142 [Algoriella xinjiangensis]